ncbi:MAG: IclR family transcriptional regulator [Chloroflexi bacterium]|nr:IclR family transcriptional regulator [Chloroflexota bacterium]
MKLTALEKALAVMEYLGDRGDARLIEVSRDLDLSRATAFRTLSTLERRGFVRHHRDRMTYSLGPTISDLARGVAAVSLVEVASAALDDLSQRTGETVNLGVLRRGRLMYAAIVDGSYPLRMSAEVSAVIPFHATALGKAVLARLPGRKRRALVGPGPYEVFTKRTLTTWPELDAELSRTELRGFAIDDEESDIGAVCVAAAVIGPAGDPVGAISVSAVAGHERKQHRRYDQQRARQAL